MLEISVKNFYTQLNIVNRFFKYPHVKAGLILYKAQHKFIFTIENGIRFNC